MQTTLVLATEATGTLVEGVTGGLEAFQGSMKTQSLIS